MSQVDRAQSRGTWKNTHDAKQSGHDTHDCVFLIAAGTWHSLVRNVPMLTWAGGFLG